MAEPLITRLRSAWNAFTNNERRRADNAYSLGPSSSVTQNRPIARFSNERSIISSIYTRIAIDVAAIVIKHIKLDEQGRYFEDVDSGLNMCLLLEPNIDQAPRAFRQDIVTTLFDKGVAALVPVDTQGDPALYEEFDILTLRVGEITQWYPKHVCVSVYNEATGEREDVILEKRYIAIVENPMYAVMNYPNSTLQRLIRKLTLLDAVDEQSGSGRLDLIIQLPYVIKSEARRQQAEKRREDIEFQLKDSQYGIAYTDGTEKITQLNRPAENNLMAQIEYLVKLLYSQLGLTEDVMNGTADEAAMLNYHNRTVEPIVEAIIESMQRSFLGVAGTRDGERIRSFRNPFKFVPIEKFADIADKLSRNEIMSPNEIRELIGVKPSSDPKADKLMNSNMPQPNPTAQSDEELAPS